MGSLCNRGPGLQGGGAGGPTRFILLYMKRVSYAGGSFVSGDRIVEAVTRFAAANANAERAAEIEVPAVDIDGRPQMIAVVLGPREPDVRRTGARGERARGRGIRRTRGCAHRAARRRIRGRSQPVTLALKAERGTSMNDRFAAALDVLRSAEQRPEAFAQPFVDVLPVSGAAVSTLGPLLGSETLVGDRSSRRPPRRAAVRPQRGAVLGCDGREAAGSRAGHDGRRSARLAHVRRRRIRPWRQLDVRVSSDGRRRCPSVPSISIRSRPST